MDINGLGVIVTGGASGLGAATARQLAALGANVTIFDMNADLAAQTASEIKGHSVAVNVTDEANVLSAVAEAEEKHGPTRVLVNCAGIGHAGKTVSRGEPFPLDAFKKVVDVNLIGTFTVLSKVAAGMSKLEPIGEERGVIINTASIAAYDGQVGQVAYAASKGGVVGMTLPVARDLASYGIRLMTIAPGLFYTPLLMGLPEEALQSLGKQVPFPSRLGDPSEYALLVKAIVENVMLNGEVIRLDGAIRMAPR